MDKFRKTSNLGFSAITDCTEKNLFFDAKLIIFRVLSYASQKQLTESKQYECTVIYTKHTRKISNQIYIKINTDTETLFVIEI